MGPPNWFNFHKLSFFPTILLNFAQGAPIKDTRLFLVGEIMRLHKTPNNQRKTVLLLSLSLSFCGLALEARADDLEFNSLYRSPHYLGRGNTGIAAADNHEAVFYNPAGLASGKGIYKEIVLLSPAVHTSVYTKDLVRQVAVEEKNDPDTLKSFVGHNLHLGLSNYTGLVFRRAALGILVSGHTNILLAKSEEDRGVENLKGEVALNKVPHFALAQDFWNQKLLVGGTLKYVMRNEGRMTVSAIDSSDISNQLQSDSIQKEMRGVGLDLGLIYRFDKIPWRLGLHAQNVGSTRLEVVDSEEGSSEGESQGESSSPGRSLPQKINLGSAYEFRTKLSSMLFLLDFHDITGESELSTFKRLHLGGEMNVAKIFGFVGGLNQGYPTAGLYLNLYVLRMDIGVYAQEVGGAVGVRPDQRFYFRLMAGF